MFKDISLNSQQYAAAAFTGGNLLLAAGPGSGKTHTMTARILFLIEERKIDPSSILVITFTKDAALSMQRRFGKMSDMFYPVAFGTFHSVFYHMITEYKRNDPPILIFEKNKIQMAGSVLRKFMGKDYVRDNKSSVTGFCSAITYYKNTLDTERSALLMPEECRPFFSDMFGYYEAVRKKTGQMDFDDMVYDCRELLIRDKAFSRKWKNRFTRILIDEFQDINPVQYETVKLLAGKRTEVFAVGDDDQSIYGFRGAEPGILKKYVSEMNAQTLHLDTNYRSDAGIVRSSLSVIEESSDRIHKELISSSDKEGKVNIRGFDDRISEYANIADSAGSSSDAVLFRTNLEMQGFASYLTSRDKPYIIREKTDSCYEHFILKEIISYMKLASGCGYANDLEEIINKPQRYINVECIIGCDGNIDNIIRRIMDNPGIKNAVIKIKNLKDLKKDLSFMKNLSPSYAIEYLYKKTGYEKYIRGLASTGTKKAEEYSDILDKALELASVSDSFDEFFELKERYEEDLQKAKKKNCENAVNLMTVHASKGLEFKRVWIPDCNEGIIPHGRMPDEKTVDEERRIFYVAMTRAISELNMFYIKQTEYTKYVPSRFLNSLINFS
ncbi:MAG: ATP-dependent helicase [Lachnospiraceae bacterium]|nr:ATP-dependent helicase [Lachnospiraceae bacterium]